MVLQIYIAEQIIGIAIAGIFEEPTADSPHCINIKGELCVLHRSVVVLKKLTNRRQQFLFMHCFAKVFSNCSFLRGYLLLFGSSLKGSSLKGSSLKGSSLKGSSSCSSSLLSS